MEIDSDKADGDKEFELEGASTTIEEAPIHVATSSTDEALCPKTLALPAPKVSLARTIVKSACTEQMLLLGKMDAHRFMENRNKKRLLCL